MSLPRPPCQSHTFCFPFLIYPFIISYTYTTHANLNPCHYPLLSLSPSHRTLSFPTLCAITWGTCVRVGGGLFLRPLSNMTPPPYPPSRQSLTTCGCSEKTLFSQRIHISSSFSYNEWLLLFVFVSCFVFCFLPCALEVKTDRPKSLSVLFVCFGCWVSSSTG